MTTTSTNDDFDKRRLRQTTTSTNADDDEKQTDAVLSADTTHGGGCPTGPADLREGQTTTTGNWQPTDNNNNRGQVHIMAIAAAHIAMSYMGKLTFS
jgi:hypothetical protein